MPKGPLSNIKFFRILTYFSISLLIFFFLFYFWISDLSSWDMPGHLFLSFFYQKYLWPEFQGWNHLAFGGYPQGYFYPSLFHWLVGGLAKLIPLVLAFKIVFSLSFILLFISLVIFLRRLGFKDFDELIALIWIFIFFLIKKYDLGGDFYSTFTIGLVNFQFALPFYFLFLSFLKEGTKNFKNVLISSIFLSIIILTHAFVSLATLISSIVFFFLFYFKKAKWKLYFFHLFITFLLTSFWLIPFIYFSSYKVGVFVGKSIIIHPIFFLLFIFSLLIIAIKNDTLSRPILLFLITFFIFFNVSQYFVIKILPNTPLHLYRFLSFIYIFISIIVSRFFVFLTKEKIGLSVIFSLILLFLGFFLIQNQIFPFYQRSFYLPIYNLDISLGIAPSEATEKDILFKNLAPHVLSHSLLLKNNRLLNGLFVESSESSLAIQSLFQEIYDLPFTWGVNFYQPNPDLALDHLRYLGVCWILSFDKREILKDKEPIVVKAKIRINDTEEKRDLYLYTLPCSLFEIIGLPKAVSKEWRKEVNQWWSNPDLIKRVLVEAKEKDPILEEDFLLDPLTKIEFKDFKAPNYYRFEIKAKTKQFVYIKIPYFPNWHAYENGKEIKIFKASPSLMVIKAKGDIELKFEKSKIEKITLLLSSLSFLGIILLFFLKR